MKEECLLKAAAVYSHLDEVYKIDVKLAETKDPKSIVGMAENAIIYFNAVYTEGTHPGRQYYTAEEAKELRDNFGWLSATARDGFGVNLPLRVLKDKLFNMAIEKAVACECEKEKS